MNNTTQAMDINRLLWSVYAVFYDTLLQSPLYQELMDQLVESLALSSAHTLLDAGCGTGNLGLKILSCGYTSLQIEAVDSSSQMLRVARQKSSNLTHFRLMNLNQQLGFSDSSFDRVAAIHVLYALTDPKSTLKDLYRVLRPGGILVAANPRRGANVSSITRANLSRLGKLQRPLFLLNAAPLMAINLLIAKAGEKSHFHFWKREDWESALVETGFSNFSIHLTYSDQSYLVVAGK
jgi:ubiquinone/menaquinone biosynthesis C-methylase UbiE